MNTGQRIGSLASAFVLSMGLGAAVLPAVANAENNDASANEVVPRRQEAASMTLTDGRNITIHREDPSGVGNRAGTVYFHKPVFAFEESPRSLTNRPAVVWNEATDNSHTYVQIRLAISSPEVREKARAVVIEQDKSIQDLTTGVDATDIEVRAWPLKLLHLNVKHAVTGKLYGEAFTESLATVGDVVTVNLKISTIDFPEFIKAFNEEFEANKQAKSEKQKLKLISFVPEYTYKNARVAFGQIATTITQEVTQKVEDILESEQVRPNAPIFQRDAARITGKLKQAIRQTITATDSRVLNHIPALDVSTSIIQPQTITFSDLMGKDKALLASVAEYLKASVETVKKNRKEHNNTTDTRENETTKKINATAGFDNSIKASLGGDLTDREKNELKRDYGVTFTEDTEKNTLQPHSIQISFLRNSWQQNFTDIVKTAYLSMGTDDSFSQDSAVHASFTRRELNISLKDYTITSALPFSGILPGMAFCSFRADVPKGFVKLDGTAKFPKEKWVPKQLHGHAVDMREKFAAGATNADEIGTAGGGEKIQLPGIVLDGNKLSLGGLSNLSAFPSNSGPYLAVGADAEGQFRPATGPGGGYMIAKIYNREYNSYRDTPIIPFSSPTSIGGQINVPTQDIESPDPDHIKCQWIMRLDVAPEPVR